MRDLDTVAGGNQSTTASSPKGLTFSGLTPEDHDDLFTTDMCQEEHFFEALDHEASKDDQMIFTCKPCKFIIKILRKVLGQDISQEAIKQAASLVCHQTRVFTELCNTLFNKYLNDITRGIVNDKSPQEICVKIRMCRPEIGDQGAGTLLHPGEKHRVSSRHRQLLPS